MGPGWAHDGGCTTYTIREFTDTHLTYRLRLEQGHDLLVEKLSGDDEWTIMVRVPAVVAHNMRWWR